MSSTNRTTASTVIVTGPAISAVAINVVFQKDLAGAQTTRPAVASAPSPSTRHTFLRIFLLDLPQRGAQILERFCKDYSQRLGFTEFETSADLALPRSGTEPLGCTGVERF